MSELPSRQGNSRIWMDTIKTNQDFIGFADTTMWWYENHARNLKLDPHSINVITEFGCGIGYETLGILNAFPRAKVQVIDYWDEMWKIVRGHERVDFHQGLFTDVLQRDSFLEPELTTFRFTSRHHGFGNTTIHLLKRHVGKGFLIVSGDNDDIQHKGWFKDNFQLVDGDPFDIDSVWKIKQI